MSTLVNCSAIAETYGFYKPHMLVTKDNDIYLEPHETIQKIQSMRFSKLQQRC